MYCSPRCWFVGQVFCLENELFVTDFEVGRLSLAAGGSPRFKNPRFCEGFRDLVLLFPAVFVCECRNLRRNVSRPLRAIFCTAGRDVV
jgi:hypothetical protein